MILSGSGIGGRKVIVGERIAVGVRRAHRDGAGGQRGAQRGRDVAAVDHVILVHDAPTGGPVRAGEADQTQ